MVRVTERLSLTSVTTTLRTQSLFAVRGSLATSSAAGDGEVRKVSGKVLDPKRKALKRNQ